MLEDRLEGKPKEERKSELVNDISDLEVEINKKFHQGNVERFKEECVTGKSLLKLEMLRGEIKAIDMSNQENSGLLITMSFALSFVSALLVGFITYFSSEINDWAPRSLEFIVILIYLALLIWLIVHIRNNDKAKKKEVQHNTHLIELMNLLIERKRELKNY